jgi:hypothetical protein
MSDESIDDVQGHHRTPPVVEDDDVQGHHRTPPRAAGDDDDVEGHARTAP